MLLLWFCLFLQNAHASDNVVTLAPIVVEGTAADALQYDPVIPPFSKPKLESQSASGSVIREMADDLPMAVTDYGQPGVTTQFRGLGRTVEDTNVQALGIPLNPPQGGGFDFSTFPQFFWSGYSFQAGPSRGAYDPQAVSGTVTLTPWTAQSLDQKGNHARGFASYNEDLKEIAAAGKYDNEAFLLGWSFGNASGPSGSLSGKVYHDGLIDSRVHLLATDLTTVSPGSLSFSTPNATLKTARYVPILQNEFHISNEMSLKNSFYYDRDYVRYYDPDSGFFTNDRAEQFGTENALLWGDTTLGLSARRQNYREIGFEAPADSIIHAQAGHTWHLQKMTVDGTLDADALSGSGVHPGASAGIRDDLLPEAGIYLRGSYAERFPSLLARYYRDAFFVPNPDLSNETIQTAILGGDAHFESLEAQLQLIAEWRQNAQVNVPYQGHASVLTTANVGNVQSLSAVYGMTENFTPWLAVTDSIRLSASQIDATQSNIPYDPHVTNLLRVRLNTPEEKPRLQGMAVFRALSRASDGLGGDVPGYVLTDLQFDERLLSDGALGEISLQERFEDLFDRQLMVIGGYPWTGRQFSVSIVGNF